MIRMQVSAVFQVRDSFTGLPIEGSRMLSRLDGALVRLQTKPGGYLVAVNILPGKHQLMIQCSGFQDEYVDFEAGYGFHEYYVTLKPSRQYLFRQSVTRLQLQMPAEMKNSQVWISAPGYVECKVAQTKAEAGCERFRVYCKGSSAGLPVPGAFLIEDGENSEVVLLSGLSEEECVLESPLQREHARSRRLLPVMLYRTDAEAGIYAAFSRAGVVVVYSGSGQPLSRELTEGDNCWNLNG